jgi:hypothetical protein
MALSQMFGKLPIDDEMNRNSYTRGSFFIYKDKRIIVLKRSKLRRPNTLHLMILNFLLHPSVTPLELEQRRNLESGYANFDNHGKSSLFPGFENLLIFESIDPKRSSHWAVHMFRYPSVRL